MLGAQRRAEPLETDARGRDPCPWLQGVSPRPYHLLPEDQ